MERTTDILQSLAERKTNQFLVGFAAETENPVDYGVKKLKKKGLDAIVINNVAADGAGFGSDTNVVTYVNRDEKMEEVSLASKPDIADRIMTFICVT